MRRRRWIVVAVVTAFSAFVLYFFGGNVLLLSMALVVKIVPTAAVHGDYGYYKSSPVHTIDGVAGHGTYRLKSVTKIDGKTYELRGRCWVEAPLADDDHANLDWLSALLLDNAAGPVSVRRDGWRWTVTGWSAQVIVGGDGINVSNVRPPDGFDLQFSSFGSAGIEEPAPRC